MMAFVEVLPQKIGGTRTRTTGLNHPEKIAGSSTKIAVYFEVSNHGAQPRSRTKERFVGGRWVRFNSEETGFGDKWVMIGPRTG